MSNPSMTGDAPEIIAWLHTMVEPDGQIHKFFTWDAKNPWSHWMESYQEQCVHSALPLVPVSLITKQADEIERLTRERDAYAQSVKDLGGIVRHNVSRATTAETSHAAARENFLTMQGTAAALLTRAEKAEAELAARNALESRP